MPPPSRCSFLFFFFNDTATTEIYTLFLHDALPICHRLDQFEEEAVGPHIGDDCGKFRLWLLRDLALEELEQLDFHALALGFGAVDFGEAEMLAEPLNAAEIVAGAV